MRKLWLVARHEYRTMTRRRAFALSTLAIPLIIGLVILASVLVATRSADHRPLGYVDQAGVVKSEPGASKVGDLELRSFDDERAARASLDAGQIQAFYVLPADYLRTGQVRMIFAHRPPDGSVQMNFDAFLRANLLAGLPDATRQRLAEGFHVTARSAGSGREFNEAGFLNIVLPFLAGFLFIYAVLASSGYLLQAVTTEKESRTVEIMATSLSPVQMMAGKAAGLMAVALTQLFVWLMAVVLGLVIVAQVWELASAIQVPWGLLIITLFFFLPAYALMAGLMIAIGSAVTDTQQGQQIAGIVNLLFIFPFFFTVVVFTNPNSPLMVALSLFPTTSFLTILMRWSVTTIPAWQLAASWLVLVASALFSIWAASRVYRVGMLNYGQRLDWQAVVAAVRGR